MVAMSGFDVCSMFACIMLSLYDWAAPMESVTNKDGR